MPEGVKYEELKTQADAINEAFGREFKRFERFVGDRMDANRVTNLFSHLQGEGYSLKDAEVDLQELSNLRTRYMGKKSEWAATKKMIGRVADNKERAWAGQHLLMLEIGMTDRLEYARLDLNSIIEALRTDTERIDVTLPGRRPRRGHLHPITLLRQKIEDIFVSLGYAIEDDREIETDFYNFTALNIPDGHPARDPLDTFYTVDGFALRSQTSTVQIHAMQRRDAPLRMIAPGRVFRRDTPDATHNPMFYQVEGLCVDRGITMEHLKGTLTEMIHRLVGPETRTRFRPSYFPFTEPSAEVDYSCFKCNGAGCRICKQSGWIELGGSGMVHPNVLQAVGIDPEEFSGFAFGFGIDRMSALMYKLDDIRLLFENDVRFLEQFN
ncbi:MAG TPA: phenylalanine--tRNA ligase subunit alpha [Pyrinomonadaceae bacterium]|jgi:phenylalanyl-tRNA synthetase alpha chain|nr:phenylalanine--tRNA ligase subunit alpha [Pyrinomonadaceae bacterium]